MENEFVPLDLYQDFGVMPIDLDPALESLNFLVRRHNCDASLHGLVDDVTKTAKERLEILV